MQIAVTGGARRRPFIGAAAAVAFLLGMLAWAGPGLPLGVMAGLFLLGWAASSPRFGLTAAIVTALLVPLPLAFRVGSFSLTIGRLVGFAFLIGWLASLSRPDGPVVRRTGMEAAMFAFTAASLVSLAGNSAHLENATITAAIRGTLVLAVDYFAFFFAAVSILRAGRHHLDRVLRIVTGVVVFVAALGLIEKATGHNVFSYVAPGLPGSARSYVSSLAAAASQTRGGQLRIQSTTEGPNELGAILVLVLPLILHYSTRSRTGVRRAAWLTGAAVCLVAGIFTESRSVLLGFVLDVVVYGACMLRARLSRRRVVAVMVIAAGSLLAFPHARSSVVGAVTQAARGQDSSVSSRQLQFGAALGTFADNPVFGLGPETLSEQAFKQRGATLHLTLDDYYVGTLAEEGLLGIVGILAIVVGSLAIGVRRLRSSTAPADRSLAAGLLAAMAAWAVLSYLFDSLAFYAPTKLWLLLMAALVAMGTMDYRGPDDRSVAVLDTSWPFTVLRRNGRLVVAVAVAALGLGVGFAVESHPPFKATTVVEVMQPRLVASPDSGLRALSNDRDLLPTYTQVATSDPVLLAAARATGWTRSIGDLRDKVTASVVNQTLLMQITVADPNPGYAADLSNAVAGAFVASVPSRGGDAAVMARVFESATVVSPRSRSLNAGIIVIAGLGLAVVLAFWREYLSTRPIIDLDRLVRQVS